MRTKRNAAFTGALIAGLMVGVLGAGSASAAIYMKAGDIKGGVIAEGYEDWIELDTASWGVSQSGSFHVGGGGGAGKASFKDFSWTQELDASTPVLFFKSADGEQIDKVTIDWVRRDAARPEPYFQMELTKVLVSSLDMSSSSIGEDTNTVSGGFNYAEIEMTYWNFKKDGSRGAAVGAKYDVARNEGSLAALASVYAVGSTGAALTSVPVPAAGWLLGSAVLGLVGLARRRKAEA